MNSCYKHSLHLFYKTAPTQEQIEVSRFCLLYTSDAADERSSVDLGGRRIIKKKTNDNLDRGDRIRK